MKVLNFHIIYSNKICIRYNMKVLNFHIITNTNLIWVDNGVGAETVPVNTSFLNINKDAFLLRCKLGKTIISIITVYKDINHKEKQRNARWTLPNAHMSHKMQFNWCNSYHYSYLHIELNLYICKSHSWQILITFWELKSFDRKHKEITVLPK